MRDSPGKNENRYREMPTDVSMNASGYDADSNYRMSN